MVKLGRNAMTATRRLILLALAAGLAGPVLARPKPQTGEARFAYRGFSVDLSGAAPGRRPELAAYIRQQIDLVESLSVRSDIKAWFRTVAIAIDPNLPSPGHFSRNGLTLNDGVSPADNPVLLHELLHGYQAQRLGDIEALRRFYERARTSGDWPEGAYMLSNMNEFFAMTASVALWGRAARPPSTREELRRAMPVYYDWLVREFGLQA
jgi:hypothetical protein